MTETAHEIVKPETHQPFVVGDTVRFNGQFLEPFVGPVVKVRKFGGLEIMQLDKHLVMTVAHERCDIVCPAGGWNGALIQDRKTNAFFEIMGDSGEEDEYRELYSTDQMKASIFLRKECTLVQRSSRHLREMQTIALAKGHL